MLERREAPAGILQVPERRFEVGLRQQVGSWLAAAPGLPVVASGMIGSRQGWIEAPYAPCPAGPADLTRHLARHRTAAGIDIHFVPGLSVRGADGMPDVMRGEETQIAGRARGSSGDPAAGAAGHSQQMGAGGGRRDQPGSPPS